VVEVRQVAHGVLRQLADELASGERVAGERGSWQRKDSLVDGTSLALTQRTLHGVT
jgi:hypothetical protein